MGVRERQSKGSLFEIYFQYLARTQSMFEVPARMEMFIFQISISEFWQITSKFSHSQIPQEKSQHFLTVRTHFLTVKKWFLMNFNDA